VTTSNLNKCYWEWSKTRSEVYYYRGVLSEGYKCRAGSGRAEQGYVIVDMRFLAEGRVTMKTLETQMDTFLRDHFIHDTYISCYQLNCMVTFMDTKCHITLQPCGV